jgi:hypothetical protein
MQHAKKAQECLTWNMSMTNQEENTWYFQKYIDVNEYRSLHPQGALISLLGL